MKSTSHFAMGHLLYAALENQGIHLNRCAFIYGNIAPDYLPAMLLAPHFTRVCSKTIDELSQRLSAQPLCQSQAVDAEYSKQLGRLCHFACDYFCFAHSRDFSGSLKQHAVYENELDSFLRKNCLELLKLDGETAPLPYNCAALVSDLEKMKLQYLSVGFSPKNDLCFAFNACLNTISGLVRISRDLGRQQQAKLSHDCNLNKGYARGDCYVFRMFLYKNRNRDVFFLPGLMEPLKD